MTIFSRVIWYAVVWPLLNEMKSWKLFWIIFFVKIDYKCRSVVFWNRTSLRFAACLSQVKSSAVRRTHYGLDCFWWWALWRIVIIFLAIKKVILSSRWPEASITQLPDLRLCYLSYFYGLSITLRNWLGILLHGPLWS